MEISSETLQNLLLLITLPEANEMSRTSSRTEFLNVVMQPTLRMPNFINRVSPLMYQPHREKNLVVTTEEDSYYYCASVEPGCLVNPSALRQSLLLCSEQ